jgi:hypothetical protein
LIVLVVPNARREVLLVARTIFLVGLGGSSVRNFEGTETEREALSPGVNSDGIGDWVRGLNFEEDDQVAGEVETISFREIRTVEAE